MLLAAPVFLLKADAITNAQSPTYQISVSLSSVLASCSYVLFPIFVAMFYSFERMFTSFLSLLRPSPPLFPPLFSTIVSAFILYVFYQKMYYIIDSLLRTLSYD